MQTIHSHGFDSFKKRAFFKLILALILISCTFSIELNIRNKHLLTDDVQPTTLFKQLEKPKLKGEASQFLVGQMYKGSFQSLQSQNLFDYLQSREGDIEAIFFSDPLKSSATYLNSLEIFLFNPKYHDLKAVGILIDLGEMKEDGVWAELNAKIKMEKFWKGRTQGDTQQYNNVNYTVEVKNFNSKDASAVTVQIDIDGPKFRFRADLDYWRDLFSTAGYAIYTTLVVGIQIFCAIRLLQQIDNQNPAIISKMSLLTLSICNIEDFYLTMVHIEYIMSSGTAYLFFVLPAIAYLILFVIFDMKMLFLVWRSHHMRDIENAQALRKKLTTFYIQFYLGLFIYLTLNYFFQYEGWLIFIEHLILLPQIVHNVRLGNNPGFSPYYIIGFLASRYLIPLYQRACPGNHFVLEPMPILISILGCLYIMQMTVLYFQSKKGPRFFIPRFLLPNYYNYNVKLKLSEQNKEIDCSICLLNIFAADPNVSNNLTETMLSSQSGMEENLMKQINIMKTPCNHYFHKDCLTKWIDVKLQCPTCRKPLPAM